MSTIDRKFDDFKAGCVRAMAARPECAGWTLQFDQQDGQREWIVTAIHLTLPHRLTLTCRSATATPSTPADVVEGVVRMIRDLSA